MYIDIWLPFPDALIAGKLCGPSGPCRYALRKLPGQDNEITKNFLLNHVTPKAKRRLEEKTVALLHPVIQEKIIKSYKSVDGELPGSISHPGMKIPIFPQGYVDQLYITKLLIVDDGLAGAGAAAISEPSLEAGGNYMELMTAILGAQLLTQRRIEDVKGELLYELTRISSNCSC